MALQSGAMVVPEKVPVQWYSSHQLPPPPHLQVDEREGFLIWLRGEFAAANAIIDALCHHLRAVGDPGEYDGVIGCIQQRRCNWNPILHMQQYFSVAEVVYALQHAGWKRQQQRAAAPEGSVRVGGGGKDFKRGGRWQRGGAEVQVNGKDLNNGYAKGNSNAPGKLEVGDKIAKVEEKEEKKEINEKYAADRTLKRQGSVQGIVTHADESCNVDGSEIIKVSPRTFVANEICEGKLVNVAEGMKLSSFYYLKEAHERTRKRDNPIGYIKTEPIPELLQDIIQRVLAEQVVSVKPDSVIVDVFNEGDYSQPYMWSQSFGRPVCLLFLTECEMSFSRVITADHPGDFRGALKLSLSPGSMLVMQGRSSDFARHAISSQRKQRILITFAKSQPKKLNAEAQGFPPPPSNWAPPPTHIRPGPAKHFGPLPPTPGPHPQPNNCIQPIFVPGPVKKPSFPPQVPQAPGWPAGPPPRLPLPGTGVFIPPQGSGNNTSGQQPSSTENMGLETISARSLEENGGKKLNDGQGLQDKRECNGTVVKNGEEIENMDAVVQGGE
ncbi:hydroxyproline-rich glycoprotein family protein [Striga asiatica]|uniref:Hydroxyproline-rich glycoprotein family protein n=1 Tax=Striga asiatica TaxID=4170 RepID=A0A5A7PX00_STRAF|nr:hydroxyproline-rich glycoprotein family protein [Striga asiatica]